MRVHPGEPARNAATMLRWIAEQRGVADLLVFPELCVPGYFLGDAWERTAFLHDCESWNARIVAATGEHAESPAVVFGSVAVDWDSKGEDGRPRKHNVWMVAAGGKTLEHSGLKRPYGVKILLPHYREFEDGRHFYGARELARDAARPWEDFVEPVTLTLNGSPVRLGVLLCEDAWEDDYAQKPVAVLAAKKPDLVLNLSASPFTRGKNDKRNRVFGTKAKLLGCPLIYVNATGIQNNGKTLYTFDGSTTVYDAEGTVRVEMAAYEEAVSIVDIEGFGLAVRVGGKDKISVSKHPGRSPEPEPSRETSTKHRRHEAERPNHPEPSSAAEIHRALRYGMESFLASTGLKKVVIGISGGIDSAVVAALFREFLPPEHLLLVNMPSRFNSATTRSLASRLAVNLGCLYAEVPIEDSLTVTRARLHGLEAASADGAHRVILKLEGLADENAQARDRGSGVLAALASAFGAVFSCNANKAELTVGYGTLYGDIAGFLAPLGDLWKHDVYALGRHLNGVVYACEAIPSGIFDLVPSAELGVHHAVDEGKGDPLFYPYHDGLFFAWVQRWNRATPEEILEWYAAGTLTEELKLPESLDLKKLFPTAADFVADVERWWNLYNGIGVAKRVQAPPVLAVSSRSFGFDHRESLGPPVYTQRYGELKKNLLG
jgi:NAD+ synthase (glutamine-hydrolysing)